MAARERLAAGGETRQWRAARAAGAALLDTTTNAKWQRIQPMTPAEAAAVGAAGSKAFRSWPPAHGSPYAMPDMRSKAAVDEIVVLGAPAVATTTTIEPNA